MDGLQRNIDRYQFYACAAPVVGSTNRSHITAGGGEDKIHFEFGPSDLARLKEGLLMTCRLFFHSTPPPRRILLGTPDNWEVHDDTYEDRIQAIENLSSIQIGTSHPQGGNGLSAGPREGVVGPDFRVHGTRNVYVADASVFPTSIGVNPHWTVMAIADLAATRVAES